MKNPILGNILNHDLLDLWNSPLAKEIRQVTVQGSLARPCMAAPNCPFHVYPKKPFEFVFDSNYPTYIEIDLPTSHCNIGGNNPSSSNPACIMCIRNFLKDSAFGKDSRDITNIICEKVKPLMKNLNKFSVLGVAEPFWKDAVFDVFDAVDFRSHKNHIQFETNHNVTCFGPKTQEKFLENVEYSNLQFSLDAASPETYMKIRRLDAYDLCVKNLSLWLKNKNENHKAVIWNNINLLNVHEMKDMVLLASDLGVDIIMLPTHNQNNQVSLGEILINEKNVNIFKKHSQDAMELAFHHKVNLEYVTPFDIIKNDNQNNLVQINTQ
jgi:hypothetical protein